MKGHTVSTGVRIASAVCLLFLLPVVWAQQPKPGGTLRVAYESDVAGLDPHLSPGIQAGQDLQRYLTENMMIASVASVPFLQAARPYVQGYEHLHGFKIQFVTTWLSK